MRRTASSPQHPARHCFFGVARRNRWARLRRMRAPSRRSPGTHRVGSSRLPPIAPCGFTASRRRPSARTPMRSPPPASRPPSAPTAESSPRACKMGRCTCGTAPARAIRTCAATACALRSRAGAPTAATLRPARVRRSSFGIAAARARRDQRRCSSRPIRIALTASPISPVVRGLPPVVAIGA